MKLTDMPKAYDIHEEIIPAQPGWSILPVHIDGKKRRFGGEYEQIIAWRVTTYTRTGKPKAHPSDRVVTVDPVLADGDVSSDEYMIVDPQERATLPGEYGPASLTEIKFHLDRST